MPSAIDNVVTVFLLDAHPTGRSLPDILRHVHTVVPGVKISDIDAALEGIGAVQTRGKWHLICPSCGDANGAMCLTCARGTPAQVRCPKCASDRARPDTDDCKHFVCGACGHAFTPTAASTPSAARAASGPIAFPPAAAGEAGRTAGVAGR